MRMGGEGHQFHAMDFLFYAYMQSGRDADAKALIEEIRAMRQKTICTAKDMIRTPPRWRTFSVYPIEMHDSALPCHGSCGLSEYSMIYWARAIGSAHLQQAR